MARHIHVEAKSTPGEAQFVTCDGPCSDGHKHKKKNKHHHHHKSDDVVKVRREKWEALKERERTLSDLNKSLAVENTSLKTNLAAVQGELHRVAHDVVIHLQNQLTAAAGLNQELRRSLSAAEDQAARYYREAEVLRRRVDQLENENKNLRDVDRDLRSRIKHLGRQLDSGIHRRVSDLTKELDRWKDEFQRYKDKYESLVPRHENLIAMLERKDRKIAAYEDILRRRGLL